MMQITAFEPFGGKMLGGGVKHALVCYWGFLHVSE